VAIMIVNLSTIFFPYNKHIIESMRQTRPHKQ
jgi:hypothetical protein